MTANTRKLSPSAALITRMGLTISLYWAWAFSHLLVFRRLLIGQLIYCHFLYTRSLNQPRYTLELTAENTQCSDKICISRYTIGMHLRVMVNSSLTCFPKCLGSYISPFCFAYLLLPTSVFLGCCVMLLSYR